MPHTLQLYNIFGAVTEPVWTEMPLALCRRGWELAIGCESIAPEAPRVEPVPRLLERIFVSPEADVAGEMEAIAARPPAIEGRFDVVHGHMGPRVLHALPYLCRGVPTVISLYGYDASRLLRDRAWIARYRWAAERGAVFVALSREMRDRLVAEGIAGSQTRVIHLGIDPGVWRYDPAPAPVEPRFVFTGRMVPKKGTADLLSALAILRDKHHLRAKVDLIGGGPLEGEMKSLAGRLELGDWVTFHSAVPRERVAALLAEATAFVLPSVVAPDGDCEGTPGVLMEAQAMGLPCVTTRHAGNPEVLPPESPLLVGERSPAELAEAMLRAASLSAGERRALQEAGRKWIEAHFNLHEMVEQCDQLYREMIRGCRVG
jgi:glycosyltransferase involved in cell wall biosynthesis